MFKKILKIFRRKPYRVFHFKILISPHDIACDDLLGPLLAKELGVFPAGDSDTSAGHVFSVWTENEEVVLDDIVSMFHRHQVQAEFLGINYEA